MSTEMVCCAEIWVFHLKSGNKGGREKKQPPEEKASRGSRPQERQTAANPASRRPSKHKVWKSTLLDASIVFTLRFFLSARAPPLRLHPVRHRGRANGTSRESAFWGAWAFC